MQRRGYSQHLGWTKISLAASGGGVGGGDVLSSFYHIVLPAANSLHARDWDWLFPFGEDNYGCLDGCV